MRVLSLQPDADKDPDALEMIRDWIIDGELQITLAAWVWKDEPEVRGQLLAEAAGHLADAISKGTGDSRESVFAKIHASVKRHLDGYAHRRLRQQTSVKRMQIPAPSLSGQELPPY